MAWRAGDNTGPRNTKSKLNWQVVREIRQYYAEGATQGELARHYGVSTITVGRVVREESWRDGGSKPVLRFNTDPVIPPMEELPPAERRQLEAKIAASVKRTQELLAMPEAERADYVKLKAELGSASSTSSTSSVSLPVNPELTLDKIMQREAMKSAEIVERTMAKLGETGMDDGLVELGKK